MGPGHSASSERSKRRRRTLCNSRPPIQSPSCSALCLWNVACSCMYYAIKYWQNLSLAFHRNRYNNAVGKSGQPIVLFSSDEEDEPNQPSLPFASASNSNMAHSSESSSDSQSESDSCDNTDDDGKTHALLSKKAKTSSSDSQSKATAPTTLTMTASNVLDLLRRPSRQWRRPLMKRTWGGR